MRNPSPRRSSPTRTLAALARPGRALGLGGLVIALAGCQTVAPWASAEKKQAAAAAAAAAPPKADEAVGKTDFRRDVTQDQEINVHLQIGRVYESQQQYEAALAEYQKSLDACARRGFGSGVKGSGAKQAMAHRRMGGALDRLGRFAQAEAHYRSALKLSPDDARVWNDAGYSYYMQSRWADAERSLKTAAKLAPDDVKVQTNLGLTLAAQGKTDEALAALSKAGGQAIGHANLGYLLAAMGQTEQARDQYQKALTLQPNLNPARQALAALETKRVQPEQVATTMPTSAPTPSPARNADADVRRVTAPRTVAPRVTPTAVVPRVTPTAVRQVKTSK